MKMLVVYFADHFPLTIVKRTDRARSKKSYLSAMSLSVARGFVPSALRTVKSRVCGEKVVG